MESIINSLVMRAAYYFSYYLFTCPVPLFFSAIALYAIKPKTRSSLFIIVGVVTLVFSLYFVWVNTDFHEVGLEGFFLSLAGDVAVFFLVSSGILYLLYRKSFKGEATSE